MSRCGSRFGVAVVLATVVACQVVQECPADVRLPGFLNDHMVLQQQMEIRVWGWADAGERVVVELESDRVAATANENGRWSVKLPARRASREPLTLSVSGHNQIQLHDVLIGEVWLCSGQSNMEWTVRQGNDAEQEIAAAVYPLIRHVKIGHRPSPIPLDDVQAQWKVCSPETVAEFTACGYFMAKHLHQELGVPIGLVNASWGGTRVEPWTPPAGFKRVEELSDLYQSVMGRTPGTPAYQKQLANYIGDMERWLGEAKSNLGSDEILTPSPAYPATLAPFASHQDPTMLYNGMIHAVVGFRIRGAIWYQGESNHREALYVQKKQALINGWRELWRQGDFPFYYVQIAPFQYGDEVPTILPEFWEQQSEVQAVVPHTRMVVTNDIATPDDIHPTNKQDVGNRLALLALKYTYGREELVASSPTGRSFEIVGDKIRIDFGDTGGGLKTRDGNPPSHFEIIGTKSGGFHPAEATIKGDSIWLASPAVKQPVAFRFAWHKLAEPNLTGGTGLPVGAFRGGQVPEFIHTIPDVDDYTLVYDLDLAKLAGDVTYASNHSAQIGGFDRIGYLVELESAAHGNQALFVSMDAFTDDVKQIAIPTLASTAHFQQQVENMNVFTTVSGLTTGQGITGNIEFWPNNYGPRNSGDVAGAANDVYDFGDQPSQPEDGYGSMQVHNFAAGETLFAINHWKQADTADIGIGNSAGENKDWTFTKSAGSYSSKRLRVYVRKTD